MLVQAIASLQEQSVLPAETSATFVLERTRSKEHGDFATNAAMLLAKPARKNPRAVAEALVAALPPSTQLAKVEIAGPGFINFFLSAQAYHTEVRRILDVGDAYGSNTNGAGHTVGVEFVSAPRAEPYGQVVVFLDIAGNRWDLLGPRPPG